MIKLTQILKEIENEKSQLISGEEMYAMHDENPNNVIKFQVNGVGKVYTFKPEGCKRERGVVCTEFQQDNPLAYKNTPYFATWQKFKIVDSEPKS